MWKAAEYQNIHMFWPILDWICQKSNQKGFDSVAVLI